MTISNDVDEHAYSDPEDFVDDIDDEELLGDILSKKPTDLDTFESIVVVDNIPQVGPEKVEKLKNVLLKTFKKYGDVVETFYPANENKVLKGFVFVEFDSPTSASNALKGLNKFRLDAKHIFSLVKFSDIEKYCSKDKEDVDVPEKQEFQDPGELYSWLMDEQARDVYAVVYQFDEQRQSNVVEIYQNNYASPTLIERKPNWTETTILWSPKGAYFTSIHTRGVALWGGENLGKINRFNHKNVDSVDFSPCETYLATLRNPSINHNGECIIWEIISGQQKRSFDVRLEDSWPVFKWSPDGKYFGRIGKDLVQIYETPSFGLLDKQSFKIPGVQSFEWSTKSNIFICWVPGSGTDVPAKVFVYGVPSRKELCAKSMYCVDKIFFYWHPTGDYCCARTDVKAKKGKEMIHYLNIFSFKSTKNIPVDVKELKDEIQQFVWEPNGTRFMLLQGESPRTMATLYETKGDIHKIGAVETQANFISWCPLGRYAVLAMMKTSKSAANTGSLEFIDCGDGSSETEISVIARTEHYAVYGVSWDPSGRFCATFNNCIVSKHDNQMVLFTFQGRRVHPNRFDSLYQFSWRPRPPRTVTDEQKEDIRRNFKKYQVKFEHQDKMSQSRTSKELLEKRRGQMSAFNTLMDNLQEMLRTTSAGVDRLGVEVEHSEEENVIERVVSTQISISTPAEEAELTANATKAPDAAEASGAAE